MLLLQRRLFLTEAITAASAEEIVKQLLYLESEDDRTPIRMIINSPGGDVSAGLMLYDQMKGMTVPIETCCAGTAASMAVFLLAGGASGGRSILKHGRVMLHEPLLSNTECLNGSASSVQQTAEALLETKRCLTGLLARDTGRSPKEIESVLTRESRSFTAEEAVRFGICDAVTDRI